MVQRVVFPFRGAELGGSHVATFTLAAAIQRRSTVECVVLCPKDTLIMAEAQRLGIRTVASGEAPTGGNSAITDFTYVGKRRRILQQESTDAGSVIHCNDVNTLRAWGLPARLAGMPVVYHHHALNRMWWPPHLVSLAYSNAVICVSDSTMAAIGAWRRDAVKELNPFDIDRSIDRQAARRALVSEFGWPADAMIVGWIGNFWKRKRPHFFLEVAAALTRRNQRYRFVLFGRDGDYQRREIQLLAADLGIEALTAIPGFRQSVEANVSGLDLLLAPAPKEPFGRALVEAIVLRTPVVATRGAGHSEIINTWGGGLLAGQRDTPEDVATLCTDVLMAPDRYTLSPSRVAEIAETLTPDAYADRILALYDQLVRHGRLLRPPDQAGQTALSQTSPI